MGSEGAGGPSLTGKCCLGKFTCIGPSQTRSSGTGSELFWLLAALFTGCWEFDHSRLVDVGEDDVDVLIELCVLSSLEAGGMRAWLTRGIGLGAQLDQHADAGDSRVAIDDQHVRITRDQQLVVVEFDPGERADEQVVRSVIDRPAVVADHDVAFKASMLDDDRLGTGLGVERERLVEIDDCFLGGHRLGASAVLRRQMIAAGLSLMRLPS